MDTKSTRVRRQGGDFDGVIWWHEPISQQLFKLKLTNGSHARQQQQ
ncbi:hypothetical protein T05_16504 [Trichinella murrelli]|uniref:Uncharacterized protein n=1 Tax=Trichinella murrelli TaxID=144512 RepID=A0A0V0TUI2_9BILA|nr:hypothetical protein T05_16504 [Trichinella murrelli]